ncbi:MAG: TonB-dependent receptor [Candidatus Zixiibacteriota bacterium]
MSRRKMSVIQASRPILATALIWMAGARPAHATDLNGKVVDAQTGRSVAAATVSIAGTSRATAAADDGAFTFEGVPEGPVELVVRHVAYHPWRQRLTPSEVPEIVRLQPLILEGQGIVVTGTRAVRGQSPVAFENVTRREIDRAHYAQDLPVLLSESPGVYTSSDNGNGIGYSYLSIRGFPQRRVSVLVNGVPLNDPESHEVYWIDLPDLAENLEDAQIQRGVGTTLYGSNSIGGTVNLLTSYLAPNRRTSVSSGVGAYGTRRFSVAFNSGLIDARHSVYGRFSRIVSDGYRDHSWTDVWSYFFSAARFDEKWTNRLNIFGGPEQTHLAYKGIPRRFIDGDTTFTFNGRRPTGEPDVDRRYNPFEWSGETDNFNQPQYQLLTEFRPDSMWRLENTSYYIKGRGFYDQLRSDEKYAKYHLISPDAFRSRADQLWRRRWVDNDFWGLIPKITRRHTNGEIAVGGEFNRLTARHWGEAQSVIPAPADFVPGQRYHDYEGAKTVASVFAQEVLAPAPRITVTGAVSYSFKRYELRHNRFANGYGQRVEHTTDYNLISPRLGLTVSAAPGISVFGSVSYNSQEPINDEIFDPQDFGANAGDFFRDTTRRADGVLVGSDPVMKPEKLLDWEWGVTVRRDRWRAQVNLFHMRFHDEIVWGGGLSDDGEPIRGNASRTVHQGIELTANADLGLGLSVSGNAAVYDNTFDKFTEYTWDPDHPIVDRSGNIIAGFPTHLANVRVNYDQRYVGLSGHVFAAGRLYIDNSESRAASIAPYETIDLRAEVKLEPLIGWPGMSFFCQANNVLDEEYETSGYLDDDGTPLFIPAAKRNVYVGLRVRL